MLKKEWKKKLRSLSVVWREWLCFISFYFPFCVTRSHPPNQLIALAFAIPRPNRKRPFEAQQVTEAAACCAVLESEEEWEVFGYPMGAKFFAKRASKTCFFALSRLPWGLVNIFCLFACDVHISTHMRLSIDGVFQRKRTRIKKKNLQIARENAWYRVGLFHGISLSGTWRLRWLSI